MTLIEIADMQADMLDGTQGAWTEDEFNIFDSEYYEVDRREEEGSVDGFACSMVGVFEGDTVALVVVPSAFGMDREHKANARRIVRVPRMETTIIAQAAEIERLRTALNIAGPIALRVFTDDHFVLNDEEKAEVAAIRAALEGTLK